MDTPHDFEIVETRGFFRPAASVASFREVETMVNTAIEYAHHRRIPELLVNLQDLIGFPCPTFMERFGFAERFASTAGGRVRLETVCKKE